MKRLICLAILILAAVHSGFAQSHHDLLDPSVRDLLHESLSGELAKEHVIAISRHHRIQGSRGYRDAANYVLQQLRKYGFSEKDAYIESFKSDGKVQYQTWQSPSGWDISSAELRMVEPYNERIVGYPEIAMSVMTYSNPGDVTAEVVWVGSGTNDDDYKGKDVRGKFVLATGYGGEVHRLAVLKCGAKAVVCYLDDERAKLYPDMLQYTGMWPRTEELNRVTFGFNISNRQGEKLKAMLMGGKKVVLHGWVKGIGLEPYFMDVVVAHIRGTEQPNEELVFSAHLDHPKESANDNASGSAAILDIARTLKQLIDYNEQSEPLAPFQYVQKGTLPPPKRSFRFLWVPEWNGTMAYIDAHPEMVGPELGGTFLANMNMDMVGENTELLHSKLILTRTPNSLPSCVNNVVENMAEMVDDMDIQTPRGSRSIFNYRVTSYSGGSDHMMFIDRKIPGIMFSHEPDYTHHTSEDTPDKVDPVEIERCEMIAAGAMWYLGNLDSKRALDLVSLVSSNSNKRMGVENRKLFQALEELKNKNVLSFGGEVVSMFNTSLIEEQSHLQSVLAFDKSEKTQRFSTLYQKQLRTQFDVVQEELSKEYWSGVVDGEIADERIPIRLTRGPLDFRLPASKLDSSRAAWYSSKDFALNGDERFELVNFIDGKRTALEICYALSAEFHPIDSEVVNHYIDDLVAVGVVKWK